MGICAGLRFTIQGKCIAATGQIPVTWHHNENEFNKTSNLGWTITN